MVFGRVEDNKDGTYEAKYTTMKSGLYELYVLTGDWHGM